MRVLVRAMYATLVSIFIAQAYGIELGTPVTMLLVLIVASKGIAAVPPSAWSWSPQRLASRAWPSSLLLITSRTWPHATNVPGHAIAMCAVSKGERQPVRRHAAFGREAIREASQGN
jgi:Na+/H+-dicarboxylate symporter